MFTTTKQKNYRINKKTNRHTALSDFLFLKSLISNTQKIGLMLRYGVSVFLFVCGRLAMPKNSKVNVSRRNTTNLPFGTFWEK